MTAAGGEVGVSDPVNTRPSLNNKLKRPAAQKPPPRRPAKLSSTAEKLRQQSDAFFQTIPAEP